MDCSLKFDSMKKELLVIVSNHITVNFIAAAAPREVKPATPSPSPSPSRS